MKYLTYTNSHNMEDIRIFSCMEEHKAVSLEMEMVCDEPLLFLGAGFIEFGLYGREKCYGHSESMKLDSRGELDTEILKRSMKMSRNMDI